MEAFNADTPSSPEGRKQALRAVEGMMPARLATLGLALHEAQCRVRGLQRLDHAKEASVGDFVSTEHMIQYGRSILLSVGLVLVRTSGRAEPLPQVVSHDGTPGVAVLRSRFALIHSTSGETLEMGVDIPMNVHRGTKVDKAAGVALTYSLGKVIRDVLLIPQVSPGEDIDCVQDLERWGRPFDPQKEVGDDSGDAQLAEEEERLRIVAAALQAAESTQAVRSIWEEHKGSEWSKPASQRLFAAVKIRGEEIKAAEAASQGVI